MKLSDIDLGDLDADNDPHFLDYVINLPILAEIREKEKYIIIGPKGTGKTGLRIRLESILDNDCVISLTDEDTFSISDLQTTNQNEIKRAIQAFLVLKVIDHIKSVDRFDSRPLETFSDTKLGGFLKGVFESIQINTPIATIALDKIFGGKNKRTVNNLLSEQFLSKVRDCIGTDCVWFLIDDVDSFISFDDESQRSIMLIQFIYALHELTAKKLQQSVNFVTFLKTEVFNEARKRATEIDKIRPRIGPLQWDMTLLKAMIVERLKWNLKSAGSSRRWQAFIGGPVDDFFNRLLSMSVNGPRNSIELMRLALKNAADLGHGKITVQNIENVERAYGQEVLKDLASFHQHNYKNVDDFIDIVLRGYEGDFEKDALEAQIKTAFLYDKQIKDDFGEKWARSTTAHKLIEIFYEVGVIGIFDDAHGEFIYSFERQEFSPRPKSKLCIHPGLRSFLEAVG